MIQSDVVFKINEKVRNSSSTLLEYLTNIEKELQECNAFKVPLHSLKMYKGSMGVVRTTHSAPIGQKTTGWSQTPHISEIGWNGRVQIAYSNKNLDTFGSDVFRYISIKSGSGSYNGGKEQGLYKCNYGSSLFIKDLPLVYEQYLEFIDSVYTLISMRESSDSNNRELFQGILKGGTYDKEINKMYQVLQGYNLYIKSHTNLDILYKFNQIIFPYINHKKQREVWDENKNIPWIIEDKFYRYTSDDFNHI